MEGRAVRPHEMLEWPNPDGEKGGRAEGSFGRSVGSARVGQQNRRRRMRCGKHYIGWHGCSFILAVQCLCSDFGADVLESGWRFRRHANVLLRYFHKMGVDERPRLHSL